MMNEFDERYARKLLALHDEMNLDRNDEPEVRIWHMLRSLLEFCDAQHPRLDFDAIVQDVRDDFRADQPPAVRRRA